MISSTHKFIFIHIPKTGGNSVQEALLPFADDEKIIKGEFGSFERFNVRGPVTTHKHMSLQEYVDVLGNSLSEYKTICTLRDPLDRALSLYYNPRWILRGDVDANTFDLSKFEQMVRAASSAAQSLSIGQDIQWPDFILWFDNLSQDFQQACRALGLPEIELQRLNVGEDVAGLRETLKRDPRVIEIVRERFSADYALIASLKAGR